MERRIPISWNEVREHGETESARTDNDQNPAAAMPPYRFRAAQHHPTAYEKQYRAAEQYYWQEQLYLAKKLNVLTKWLNWITGVASGVGVIGLVFIARTLVETGRQADIAERSLVLSERPWLTVEATLSRPILFYENGQVYVDVGISLKNIGHSVATDVWVDTQVVLVSHVDGTLESLNEPERVRDASCEWMRKVADMQKGGTALFPGQWKKTGSWVPLFREYVEARAFEQPGAVGKFIDPVLVGCVSYKDIFTPERHVTGFAYVVSSSTSRNGHFRVGERVPVENVHLTPHALVDAYID